MKIIEHRGSRVPALAFGTYRMKGEECYNATCWALECGYTHVDTAQAYENEEEVGRALADTGVSRADIFLTTKIHKDRMTAPEVLENIDVSLDKLRTDYVDLFLVHWPSRTVPLPETLGALKEVYESGRAKQIGISNFTLPLMREAVEEVGMHPFTNQIEYHPLLRQQKVNDYIFDHGMLLSGHSPIATGRLADHPLLNEIGAQYGKSSAQVAIRWQLEQEDVIVIPKSARKEAIEENFNVFDFALSEEDMVKIATLPHNERGVKPPQQPDWDPND